MSLLIQEVPATDAPMELLLLADPSEDNIRSYLSGSKCFVVSNDAVVVGACVVQPRDADTYELMSIAVDPARQKSGYGTALLKWVIDYYRDAGARWLEVGTGTFGYQLAFYQRQGFRVTKEPMIPDRMSIIAHSINGSWAPEGDDRWFVDRALGAARRAADLVRPPRFQGVDSFCHFAGSVTACSLEDGGLGEDGGRDATAVRVSV